MSALLTVLAAAAPALIGKATEAAAEYGVDFFGADSSVGSFLSSTFVSKKPGEKSLASEIGTAVASAMGADRGRSIDDLPSVNIPSTTPVRPGQMAAAGTAPTIPLGSGNTVPNYLQNSRNVRSQLSRIQTIPVPRSTIKSSAATVPLSSARLTSKPKLRTIQ